MTIQQTLTVPKATRHLTVDLPQPVPAGLVDVVLFFPTSAVDQKPTQSAPPLTSKEAHAKLLGMFKGSTFTVDKLLEERRRETLREDEKHERLFHEFKKRTMSLMLALC